MIPAKIGKYRIERELGKGATGTVYLATDPFSQKPVAVKQAHPRLMADPVQGQRYLRSLQNEAALVGKFRHPHIVAVIDAEVDPEQAYIVMEYIAGHTLENHSRADNLLPVLEVLEILFKCCNALDYAQRLGLIHRDIKPANILVSAEGDIKLTDFGAALSAQAEHTQLAGLVGSPAYMSPEQVRELPLTHQSDIFSLGVVMYQLLTGHLPFEAQNDFSVIYKITTEPPPPLAQYKPSLPSRLQYIIDKALAKDRSLRYPNWVNFAEDLATAMHHLDHEAGRITDTEKFSQIKSLKFFTAFSEAELWEVLQISQWRKIPRDTVLVQEGRQGNSFYILAAGQAKVSREGYELNRLVPGESFGEMAYVHPASPPRSATVTATSDVLLIKIRAEDLRKASMAVQWHFDKVFIRTLVERLAQADRLLAEL